MEPTEPERWSHVLGNDGDDGPFPEAAPVRGTGSAEDGLHAHALSVDSRQEGRTGVVVISGELTLEGGDAVEVAVAQLVADGVTDVSVDPRDLTFIDSSGLAGLIAARALVVEGGGAFRFGPATPHVARVIDLAGIHDLLLGPEAT